MTFLEIAKEANVSVAAVSRTLNNRPGVGDKIRQDVMEVINKHNYVLNNLLQPML